jgi:hypothetical protein
VTVGWSKVCGHSTQCAVLLLSVNGVLLSCGLRRQRNVGSCSVAENRFVCLLSLAPSVMVTQNCQLTASEDNYQLYSFQNVFKTCYLLNYMPVSSFEIAEILKMLLLMGFSKTYIWSEPFVSVICYCTVFEENSFISAYLMTLLISMLASRVLWKNFSTFCM